MYTATLLFAGLLLLAVSCEPPSFSPTPSISFREIKQSSVLNPNSNPPSYTDELILRIDFKDGDGNLGLGPDENPLQNNYKLTYFKKLNGKFVPVVFPNSAPNPVYNRFPTLRTDGKAGPIEGTLDLLFTIVPPPDFTNPLYVYPNDTLRFEVQIWDRDMNASNTVTSSEVVVLKRR